MINCIACRTWLLALVIVVLAAVSLCWYWQQVPVKYVQFPIKEIYSYDQVADVFAQADEHTVVTFDIDDTLISSADPFVNGNFPLMFKLRLLLSHPTLLWPSTFYYYHSIMWQQAPRQLIESQVVRIINQLKTRGTLVFALTFMQSGSYGVIKSMPEWRYAVLAGMGIIFTQHFPTMTFTQLPFFNGTHPMLYKGILCANHQKKGKVLGALLDQLAAKPTLVISFDNNRKALVSIGDACLKRDIPTRLFWYRGSEIMPHLAWNTDRALQQMDTIIRYEKWIPTY